MATKEKTTKKTVDKATEKAAVKTAEKTVAKTTAKKPVRIMVSEDALPAIDIAKIYNISTFDFFALKKKLGIDDDTLITMSEFKNKYQEIIKR